MRWAWAMATVCAGCVAAETDPPPDPAGQPYVEIGQGGGLTGWTTFRIDATGAWTSSSTTGGALVTRDGRAGPQAFLAVRDLAVPGIAALGPLPDAVCMDYGTDYVIVSTGPDAVAEVSVACPDDGVTALIRALREAFARAAAL